MMFILEVVETVIYVTHICGTSNSMVIDVAYQLLWSAFHMTRKIHDFHHLDSLDILPY